jgi:hypothetical protein
VILFIKFISIPKKAIGLDGITIEVWKSLGEIGAMWLISLFNNICRVNKMSTE